MPRRLLVPELYDMIDPPKCKFRVKPDRLVIILKTGPSVVPFSTWSKLNANTSDPDDFREPGVAPPMAPRSGGGLL